MLILLDNIQEAEEIEKKYLSRFHIITSQPVYLLKDTIETLEICEICSKLTIKTPERRLVSILLTLNIFRTLF